MAFWKRAIASLGFLGMLASPAYATGDGKQVTQVSKTSHTSDVADESSQPFILTLPDLVIKEERLMLTDQVTSAIDDIPRNWQLRQPTHPDELDKFFPSTEFLMSLKPVEKDRILSRFNKAIHPLEKRDKDCLSNDGLSVVNWDISNISSNV